MLPLPDSRGYSLCLSCGFASEVGDDEPDVPAAGPTQVHAHGAQGWHAPQTAGGSVPTSTIHHITVTRRQSRSGCGLASAFGCLPVLLVVGLVMSGLFFSLRQAGGPLAEKDPSSSLYPSSGSAIVLPGEPSGPLDVVTMATDNSQDSARVVVRVVVGKDGSDVQWKSEKLPADVYAVSLATDGDHLYMAAGNQVRLLSIKTGAEAWRTTITDKVTRGCTDCFAVVDGTLVVRSDDAFLTAFGPASSEPRWTRRLESPFARATVAGPSLVVVDNAPTVGAPAVVQTIEPASGRTVASADPVCPQSATQSSDVRMTPNDTPHPVPGTGDVVAYFGSGSSCVARWETATGTVRWRTPLAGDASFVDGEPLLTPVDLVFAQSSSGATRVDLANGKITALEAIADQEVVPRAVVGRTVVAETKATRGTAQGGLASWDLNTGKRLWASALPGGSQPAGRSEARSSDALFEGQPRTVLVEGGDKLRLVTFDGPARQVRSQDLDVASGELSAGTTRSFPTRFGGTTGTVSLTVEAVSPQRLLVSIDSLLAVIPVGAEGEIHRWPKGS